MSKYIKPTISVLNASAVSAATSSCSGSTVDAKEVLDLLYAMGYDPKQAFSAVDPCEQPVEFVDYCKFTSGVQVFYS